MQTFPRSENVTPQTPPNEHGQLARRAVVLMRLARAQRDTELADKYVELVRLHLDRHIAELRRRLP